MFSICILFPEIIVLMEVCFIGLLCGIFVNACHTFGFIEGDPYDSFRYKRRMTCLFLYCLLWISLLGYSMVRIHVDFTFFKVMVAIVFILVAFWIGKPINYIYRMKYILECKWYTTIIIYTLRVFNAGSLIYIIAYLFGY